MSLYIIWSFVESSNTDVCDNRDTKNIHIAGILQANFSIFWLKMFKLDYV